LNKIAYALIGGSIGAFISNPADLAMVKFQNDGVLKKKARKNYKNLFDCLFRLSKENGISSLWKGAVANIIRSSGICIG